MKKLTYPILLLGFLSCGDGMPGIVSDGGPHFEIVQLRDGVYAALAMHGRHAISNAGIVDMGGNKILVFDTFLTPEAGEQLKATAEELIEGTVFLVVNSNFESDHVRGNQAFTSDASVVSTTRTQRGINETEPLRLALEKSMTPGFLEEALQALQRATDERDRKDLELQISYFEAMLASNEEVIPTAPTVVWDHKLNFTGRARKVKIIPFGHTVTESDAVLLLEADSLLFASDLLVGDQHPSVMNSNLAGWRSALDSLDQLPVKDIVPGHGPITDKTAIERTREYLDMIERMAAELADGSLSTENAVPEPPFDALLRSDRFLQNLRTLGLGLSTSD